MIWVPTCWPCSTRSGVERVSYAGVSLGGMVGMWLAINAPERDRPARARLHVGVPAAGVGLGAAGRDRACRRHGRDRRPGDRPLVHAGLPASVAGGHRGRARRSSRRRRPTGTPAAATRSPAWTCAPACPDHGAHARHRAARATSRSRRRTGAAIADAVPGARFELVDGRAPGERGERRDHHAAAGLASGRRARDRRRSGCARSRRAARAAGGARRRARRPVARRRRRADGRVPGVHHPLRVGRRLGPARPRPAHPQRHHPVGAGRRCGPTTSCRCTSAARCATA